MKRNTSIRITLLLLLSYVVLALYAAPGWAAGETKLSAADCAKCHATQPADIDAKGGKHKSVSCQDCHSGHRPASKNNIPACNQCHQGKPHFELKGCLGCHKNPHTPLTIAFGENLTEPCLTCHSPQIKQLRENKSKHTDFFCTKCHGATHRLVPACTQCHKPHAADMAQTECKKCHKAHMPKAVTYAGDINSKLCASCHANAYKLLTASKAKHSTLACAFCHQDKHKMVPNCKDCHGEKHPAGMMAKFPKCGECHKIAHDLNNWTSPAAPAPQAGGTQKAKQKKP